MLADVWPGVGLFNPLLLPFTVSQMDRIMVMKVPHKIMLLFPDITELHSVCRWFWSSVGFPVPAVLLVLLHTGRSTLPVFVFEEHLSDDASSTPTPSPTPSPSVSRMRCADWLLRDAAYSEGVAEHKRGGTCRDCVSFPGGENGELQVSVARCSSPGPRLLIG